MRLNPQQLDQLINEELDHDPIFRVFSPGVVSSFPSGRQAPGDLPAEKRTGTPRIVVHNHHGWKPTLDDIEQQ